MKTLLKMSLINCWALVLLLFTVPAALAAQPDVGPIRMGTQAWLGYGQWAIAREKGIFKKYGLINLATINFAEDKDLNAALASGRIDVANVASHTALAMIAAGLPLKVVMVLDTSLTADAIISNDPQVTRIEDLKGLPVAYEEGSTSEILLSYALSTKGLRLRDIKSVPMPAAEAGSALIAKRVSVAVTYEPYLSAARKADSKSRQLIAGNALPGLISDVLVVRTDFIKSHPGQISALVSSWNDALSFYESNLAEGRNIIAKDLGAPLADMQSAFDGVQYFSLRKNKDELTNNFLKNTLPLVLKAGMETGFVSKAIDLNRVIEPQFVNAAQ